MATRASRFRGAEAGRDSDGLVACSAPDCTGGDAGSPVSSNSSKLRRLAMSKVQEGNWALRRAVGGATGD